MPRVSLGRGVFQVVGAASAKAPRWEQAPYTLRTKRRPLSFEWCEE